MTQNVANDHQQPNIPLLHEIRVAKFNGGSAISVAYQKVGAQEILWGAQGIL